MIELPESPAPNAARAQLIDFGFLQRPSSGAQVNRIDRPGSRWQIEIGFAPMPADQARVFAARIARGKTEGLRIAMPLLGVSQGVPGSPVVDGAVTGGNSLALRDLTPGYVAKEGFWLTLIDAAGVHYLHQVAAPAEADAAGDIALTVFPLIRCALADGDAVLLAEPLIEGYVPDDVSWSMEPGEIVTALGFTLEERA